MALKDDLDKLQAKFDDHMANHKKTYEDVSDDMAYVVAYSKDIRDRFDPLKKKIQRANKVVDGLSQAWLVLAKDLAELQEKEAAAKKSKQTAKIRDLAKRIKPLDVKATGLQSQIEAELKLANEAIEKAEDLGNSLKSYLR